MSKDNHNFDVAFVFIDLILCPSQVLPLDLLPLGLVLDILSLIRMDRKEENSFVHESKVLAASILLANFKGSFPVLVHTPEMLFPIVKGAIFVLTIIVVVITLQGRGVSETGEKAMFVRTTNQRLLRTYLG